MSQEDLRERQCRFESMHRQIEDRRLDEIAAAIGWSSGVGRMSHMSDDALSTIVARLDLPSNPRILDLGSGRGFLARWLRWRGLASEYVGIDFSPSAVEVARQLNPGTRFILGNFLTCSELHDFDVVFAIESTGEGAISDALAAVLLGAMRASGAAVGTVTNLKLEFPAALETSIAAVEGRGGRVEVINLTEIVKPTVERLCNVILSEEIAAAELRDRAYAECRMFLDSIRTGRYGYAALIVRPR